MSDLHVGPRRAAPGSGGVRTDGAGQVLDIDHSWTQASGASPEVGVGVERSDVTVADIMLTVGVDRAVSTVRSQQPTVRSHRMEVM